MSEEELLKTIDLLEHDRMGYLEANDKRGTRRIEKQIEKLNLELEVLGLRKVDQTEKER